MTDNTFDRASALLNRLAERTTRLGRARRFNASRYVRSRFAYHRATLLCAAQERRIITEAYGTARRLP